MNNRIYYSQEAEEYANRQKALLVLVMLSLGVGVGAAIALLFAPLRGDDLRSELAGRVENRVGSLEHQFGDLKKKFESRLSEIR